MAWQTAICLFCLLLTRETKRGDDRSGCLWEGCRIRSGFHLFVCPTHTHAHTCVRTHTRGPHATMNLGRTKKKKTRNSYNGKLRNTHTPGTTKRTSSERRHNRTNRRSQHTRTRLFLDASKRRDSVFRLLPPWPRHENTPRNAMPASGIMQT
uniref:Putative secreted protein n=1 Tax=Anopheles darlingi TaxID=43151 RepID=A0A2M4DFG6_ANODA